MIHSSKHPSRVERRSGRRSKFATVALLAIGLGVTGGGYAAFAQTAVTTPKATINSQSTIDEGKNLFQSNCATCHGLKLEGTANAPTLIGVGAAAVSFQVGTGRMPMQAQGPQAPQKPVQFTSEQISALAAYVASVSPGPAIPDARYLKGDGDTARGGELFRINCAMCHNVSGAGGALTDGKFAPKLTGVSAEHIYEAMLTGPQNMPVFNDKNLTPQDKADIITYLKYIEKNPSPGGVSLGSLGPVAEGLFIWIFGMGVIVAFTIWLAARAN